MPRGLDNRPGEVKEDKDLTNWAFGSMKSNKNTMQVIYVTLNFLAATLAK